MGTTRRKFTSEFKKKVVLEALKERNTIQELAAKYEIHPQRSAMLYSLLGTCKLHDLNSLTWLKSVLEKNPITSYQQD